MKYILLLTILLNSLLLATSQIVVGTYSTNKNAVNVKSKLDSIILEDFRFKNFLLKNSIKSTVKEKGKYFIVSLGPINDIVTQHAVLNRVKKTKFKDAFVLQLELPVQKIIKEEKEELLIDKESNIEKIEIIKITKNYKQTNMLDEYFNVIMATLTILILSILYLIIKKRQHTKNQYSDLDIAVKKEIVPINDSHKYSKDSIDNTPKSIKSDVVKKMVPKHGKITKSDFKNFQGARIMIAEDNIINQKVINGLLSDSLIDIITVDDGQEVLDFLEKDSNFSIILMDAHMPNVDGYEATRRIRSNPKYSHITVVALSGDTAQDDINNMKKAGMQDHIEKPLKMDSLYDILYAYTKINNTYVALEKALFIKDGLEVCGDDENFYKEILNDFVKDNVKYIDEIENLINNKEFSKAQEFLLDLIGIAGNIGAKRIQILAGELKSALEQTTDTKNYTDTFKNFTRNYKQLEIEVQEYINS